MQYSEHELDLIFVKNLDMYEHRLHDTLEVRTRAIRNWKKLRLLIVLLIICGKSYDMARLENESVKDDEENAANKNGCRKRLAPYIIDPMHRYKLAWDLFVGLLFLVSYFLDPFILALWFHPYEYLVVLDLQYFITCIFLINSIITPFTGIQKEDVIMHESTEDEDSGPKSAIEIAKGTANKRRGNAEALKK